MPLSLGNASKVNFQTWGSYKQKTIGQAKEFVLDMSSSAEGVCIWTFSVSWNTGRWFPSLWDPYPQRVLLDLVLQDVWETTWGWRTYLQIAAATFDCSGVSFLVTATHTSGVELVPVLRAGVLSVHIFYKASQLNARLTLHYYDAFKCRVALYKWTALLSSFLPIIGTLLNKFQISLQLSPSH